jgi:hypothetical protein
MLSSWSVVLTSTTWIGALHWTTIYWVWSFQGQQLKVDTNKVPPAFSLSIWCMSSPPLRRFFWPALACDSLPSIGPFDRCSRYPSPLPVIPVQLTVLLHRGEWDCLASLLVRYHDFPSCEFIWSIHSTDAHPATNFLGNILYDLRDWMSFVANTTLGGELL